MFISRNLHPAGRGWNALFGAAQLVDGCVRVLSLGFLHTTLPLTVSRNQARALGRRFARHST